MSGAASGIGGVILAGGLARRMGGGDKALLPIDGQPMLAHIVARIAPQVSAFIINANGDPARFAEFGAPVVADPIDGFAGPLAGILAGLLWAKSLKPSLTHVVSVAGDTPFFPADLAARLSKMRGDATETIVLAASGGRVHPVFGLWPVSLASDLSAFLADSDNRKILAFVDRHPSDQVEFSAISGANGDVDPFFNINRPDDITDAQLLARALAPAPTTGDPA